MTNQQEIFPNPVTNHTQGKIPKARSSIKFAISEMMGKTLQTKSLTNIAAGKIILIDLSSYAKGIYLAHLQVDGSGV